MDDREAFDNIATAIVAWQIAAQQLPLAELAAVVANCQDDLAQSLDSFNVLYGDHADHVPADTIKETVGAIARQAISAAIFALGISVRAHRAAHQN
jgi:hypothetical protein